MIKLSNNQEAILKTAAERQDGNVEPLPDTINAGNKPVVITALLSKGVILEHNGVYQISPAGYEAIGIESTGAEEKPASKRQQLIDLVNRKEGVTLEYLVSLFKWEKHTVRGTISNLKKTGLKIISFKNVEGLRAYKSGDDTPGESQEEVSTTGEGSSSETLNSSFDSLALVN